MLTRLKLRSVQRSDKKYLIIGMAHRRPDFHSVYQQVAERVDAEVITFNKRQLRGLPKYLKALPLNAYQSIWFDLSFKYMHRCVEQIQQCHNAVFYEQDVVQDGMPNSPWHKKFSEFYQQLPNSTVLTTGSHATALLQSKGVNALTSIKGYDPQHVFHEPAIERDIRAGFIGSTSSAVYTQRKETLEKLEQSRQLTILREVAYGSPYREALNRIQIFVSADIGLGEYMSKNFEAMACGCALIAYRQGQDEEQRLGLKHRENCLLYSNAEELNENLALLSMDEKLRLAIAESGRRHALEHFSFERIASDICKQMLTTTDL